MKNPILPNELRDYLISKGYNSELSAPYITKAYLTDGIQKYWHKQTIKDLKEFEMKVRLLNENPNS